MATVEEILAIARSQLGTRESPAGSNNVKYNTEFYGGPVSGENLSWCAVFLWWCFRQAGASELFYGGGKTASCGTLASYAKQRGQLVTSGYGPGDLVFMRFSGTAIQHVGIVKEARSGSLITIEGNTGVGNDANGGQVQQRVRALNLVVSAYRPEYEEDTVTQDQFDTMMATWLEAQAKQEPSDTSAEARAWAESNGIITGYADGTKRYKAYCTREQMVIFLHRLAKRGK